MKRNQLVIDVRVQLVLGFDESLLEAIGDSTESPEDFICRIEDGLEDGTYELEDARILICDYYQRELK